MSGQHRVRIALGVVAALVAALVLAAVLLAQRYEAGVASGALVPIAPADYAAQFSSVETPHLLIDVRTPQEFATGHIAGAINISVESLAGRLAEIPRDQPVVVYCRSGHRSGIAATILADAGYAGVRDLGGLQTWVDEGYPVAS